MAPLRPPRRGRTGRRSLVVLLVATLLASVVTAGPAGGVVGVDVNVGSDSAGTGTATAGQVPGAVGAGSPFGQIDPDEEEEEEEGNVDDDENEAGEGDDADADEPDDANDGDRDDGTGVGDLVGGVLTEVVGGPDDDRPGDGGEGTPGPVDSGSGGAVDGDGDGSAGESDPVEDPDGGDEAGGASTSDGDGSVDDRSPASQVEEPTPTESPEPAAPARLRVEDVSVNRSAVAAGEPVRITATVVNAGDVAGSRDVRLHLFGELVDARSVTVPGDGTRAVAFVRTIEAPGTFAATVGNASATITVEGEETSDVIVGLGPASQETPGFTALSAVLGLLVAALLVRLRG